jgi:hypothetical protein
MDLEDFNNIDVFASSPTAATYFSAKQALDYLDAIWYTGINRRGRRMDLIGDYAGSELFVLDGTRKSVRSYALPKLYFTQANL